MTAPAGATVLVTGNTFPHREALKNMGARWNPAERGWQVPAARAAEAVALVGPPRPERLRSGAVRGYAITPSRFGLAPAGSAFWSSRFNRTPTRFGGRVEAAARPARFAGVCQGCGFTGLENQEPGECDRC